MKLLLVLIPFLIIGCASNSTKKMESKATKEVKAEKVKAEAKAKKEIAKKKAMKASAAAKVCTLGTDKRTIDIKKLDKGCEVFYTKHGETKSIATAQNDLGYCDSIQDRVTSKLGDHGFKCE